MTVGSRQAVRINPKFFCDGPCYVLTSSSLGGNSYTPEDISEMIQEASGVKTLVESGTCLPLFFPGDCAMDSRTVFVVGDLTQDEQDNWIGKLAAPLKIPCGTLVIAAGGADPDELALAVSDAPPEENYVIFDRIAVPPGDYLVELYAFLPSTTVQVHLDGKEKLEQHYNQKFGKDLDCDYIVRLTSMPPVISMPKVVDEIGWLGEFEFRE